MREVIVVFPTSNQRLRRTISRAVAGYLRSKSAGSIDGHPIVGDGTSLIVTLGAFNGSGEKSIGRLMFETLRRIQPEIRNPILCSRGKSASITHELPIGSFQDLRESIGDLVTKETKIVIFVGRTAYLPTVYGGLTVFGSGQPFEIRSVSYRGKVSGIPLAARPRTEAFLAPPFHDRS